MPTKEELLAELETRQTEVIAPVETQPTPTPQPTVQPQQTIDEIQPDEIKRLNPALTKQAIQEELSTRGETLEDFTNQKQEPELEATFKGVFGDSTVGKAGEEVLVNGILAPLTEIGRGFTKGATSFYEGLDGVTKLLENVSGGTIKRGGLFGEWAKELRRYEEEEIPTTKFTGTITSIPYELIGRIPSIQTEFALAGKALSVAGVPVNSVKVATRSMTDPAKFALIQSLSKYQKDPEFKNLATGAAEGAAISMTFGIAREGLSLLKRGMTQAARNFVSWTTNNPKLADDFIKNPKKFNLNPFKKVKSSKELAKENEFIQRTANDKVAREKELFKDKRVAAREDLAAKQLETKNALNRTFASSKESLSESSKIKIQDTAKQADKAFTKADSTIRKELATTYDETLGKYQSLKQTQGEKVGAAIESTLNANPKVSIPSRGVRKGFNEIVNDSPFKIDKGQVLPKTAASNQTDAKTFQNIVTEFKTMTKDGRVSVGYLQNLKKDLQNLSSKSYNKGDRVLARTYQKFSELVNPANIVTREPGVAKNLKLIAEANKEFSTLMPKYEKALASYYKQDASGNLVPDINKAIIATAKNDSVALRQMRQADSALPKEDQLLPKIRKSVENMNTAQDFKIATLRNMKNKVGVERIKLNKAAKASQQGLAKEQKRISIATRNKANQEIRDFTNAKKQELNAIEDKLDAELQFAKQVEDIRGLQGAAKSGASIVQRALFYGGLAKVSLPLPGFRGLGSASIAGATAISPLGSGLLSKATLSGANKLDKLLTPLLSKEAALFSRSIIDAALKN